MLFVCGLSTSRFLLPQCPSLQTLAEVPQAIAYAYVDEDLFDFWQSPACRESLLAVLVARWFPGQLSEIAQISQTDEFQDPPGYFREACAVYMDRMKKAQC